MRNFFVGILLLFGTVAHAGVLQSWVLDTSVWNLIPTYQLGVYSWALPYSGFGNVGPLCVQNAGASTVALYVDNDLATTAPASGVKDTYIQAGGIFCSPPGSALTRSVQIRAAFSTQTSGLLFFSLYDRRG